MVLARFLPQDEQFFGHFRDAAANALEVAAAPGRGGRAGRRDRAQGPPLARPRAPRRRDHPPDLQRAQQHLRHAARPRGHPRARRRPRRLRRRPGRDAASGSGSTGSTEPTEPARLFARILRRAGGQSWSTAMPLLEAGRQAGAGRCKRAHRRDPPRRRTRPTTPSTSVLAALYDGGDRGPGARPLLSAGASSTGCSRTPPTGPRTSPTSLEGILLKYA